MHENCNVPWNTQIFNIHDDNAWKLQRTTGLLSTNKLLIFRLSPWLFIFNILLIEFMMSGSFVFYYAANIECIWWRCMKSATYHWTSDYFLILISDFRFHVQHPINRIHVDEWIDCVLSINCWLYIKYWSYLMTMYDKCNVRLEYSNIERTWWQCMKTATYHSNNQILIILDYDAWKVQRTTGLLGTSGY
jgi:hypothetical protein